MEKKKISIVVPMFFEEKVVNEFYERTKKVLLNIKNYDHEIIFIDDGSEDNTLILLKYLEQKDQNIKIISFSRNFGHQAAVCAGLRHASGDVVCIIDADLQDPPEVIHEMILLWEKGFEIVYGKRVRRKKETIIKIATAKVFYKVLNQLSNVKIPSDTGDFRIVDKKIVDIINSLPEQNKFLRGLFAWTGFKSYAFEYERDARFSGKTKYSLAKMVKLAVDGIVGFSSKPLKLIGLLGGMSIIISIILGIYTLVVRYFFTENLQPGWGSLMIAITFFAGVQLFSLWIMSEYIGRIYDETKKRPEYIAKEYVNCK